MQIAADYKHSEGPTPPSSVLNQATAKDTTSNSISSNLTPQFTSEVIDIEKVKREKVYNLIDFYVKKCTFFIFLEGVGHHFSDLPGNGFQRVIAPYSFILSCYIFKKCLERNIQFAEQYGAFVLNTILMVALIEQSIFLNPHHFQIIFV